MKKTVLLEVTQQIISRITSLGLQSVQGLGFLGGTTVVHRGEE